MIKQGAYYEISLLILSMLFLPVMADEAKILPSQTGIVEKVQYVDLNDDTVSQTKQTIQVRLLTGEFKGETVELDNMLTGNPYYDIKLKKIQKLYSMQKTTEKEWNFLLKTSSVQETFAGCHCYSADF